MEILDPDLWNDDGTPKRPTAEYMQRLEAAQSGANQPFLDYAAAKREAASLRPPEVGDMVHFSDDDEAPCRAAIVMESEGHVATLRVHIPHHPFGDWEADHDESRVTEATWHWPCKEGR